MKTSIDPLSRKGNVHWFLSYMLKPVVHVVKRFVKRRRMEPVIPGPGLGLVSRIQTASHVLPISNSPN